ncbi:MAG: vitamin B12 dependent methionine synthase [Chloroflexi bacterium]|nr:vitamin B12 dependent methionine synthase [Chloroflexota bacterium]
MDPVVLDQIPVTFDAQALMERLRVSPESDAAEVRALAEQAQAIARPKAIYREAYLSARDDEGVVIEGIRFTSRVLRVNLDNVYRVFAYVATCGTELEDWASAMDDVLHQYWSEEIKLVALRAAGKALYDRLVEQHALGKTATMNPGSLSDWPLREQQPLFALLGDPTAAIGVQLTKSCLMVPNKSVSGIRFPTEESFESCQLCQNMGCPNRRAPYDAALWERKYAPRHAREIL